MRKPICSMLFAATALIVLASGCGHKKNGGGPISTCGDSILNGSDTCDDGNVANGDGCNDQCLIEAGWICPVLGKPCVADRCGDGIVAGAEKCDLGDGNNDGTKGCTAECLEAPGWFCSADGLLCQLTNCGNGVLEGDEGCDDGNVTPFDSCSATCKKEPACTNGFCPAACGDGYVGLGEACDMGVNNGKPTSGCNTDCTVMSGFECTIQEGALPPSIAADVIFRDFKGAKETGGHPDFEFTTDCTCCSSISQGLVDSTLTDGKPVFKSAGTAANCGLPGGAAKFAQWYVTDTASSPINMPIAGTMTLKETTVGSGTYVFDSAVQSFCEPSSFCTFGSSYELDGFFPIDGSGFGIMSCDATPSSTCPNIPTGFWPHNYSFTSEVRYWFTYKGDKVLTLDFTGDDDVWVFINNVLAVDLGGVHSAKNGKLTIPIGGGTATTTYSGTVPADNPVLNLVTGGVYEVDLFHAERHVKLSNFKLTLGNFAQATSQCVTTCGDGITAGAEECDNGATTAAGTDTTCTAECKWPGHSMGG